MKKLLVLVLVVVMAAASCSVAAVAEGGVSGTISYMFWGSTVEQEIVENICQSYMDSHPGTTIEMLYVPAEYDTKMTTLVAAGEEPDVAYMNAPLGYSLAEGGKLVNIYDMVGKDPEFSLDDYVPGVWFEWDENKIMGRRIGIAGYCLYYNVDALEAAGLEPFSNDWNNPMDWDTFVEYTKALTFDRNGLHPDDEGFDPENIEQYGFSFEPWLFLSIMAQVGVQWANEEGTEFTLASEEGIEAVQKLADLIHVHHVAPSPVQSESLPGATVTLTSGMVASAVGGNWLCADFAAADANFDIGVIPSLGAESYHAYEGCGPVVIFNSTDNFDLAWDFYKYAIDLQYNDAFYSEGISIPVLKDWLMEEDKLAQWTTNDAHPSGYVGGLLTPLVESKVIVDPGDTLKNFAQQSDLVHSALQSVWLGERTAREVLTELKPQVEALMQGAYPRNY